MLTRQEKQTEIDALHQKVARANAMLAMDYRGMTVTEVNDLRGKLREAGAGTLEYRVAKNTLLKRALTGTPLEPFGGLCSGPTAIGIAYEEPAALAKVLVEYAKSNEKLRIRGGVVDGEVIDLKGVEALSKLPGKHELRGMLAGTLQAPLRNLAGTMYALLGHLRNALEQREKQLNV
jgi:large subunit ribosomal protein L10